MKENALLRRFTAAAAVAALLVAGAAGPAQAHPSNWYYVAGKWPAGATINYGLNAGFPTSSNWAGRIYDGKNDWNNAAAAGEPWIVWGLADYVNHGTWNNACSLAANNTGAVFYVNLDTIGVGVVGWTQGCVISGVRVKATISFDSTGTYWWEGSHAPPAGMTDLWSAASHEFGHFLGWSGHLTQGEAGVCPAYEHTVRNTMCPSIYPGYATMRILNTHDVHTYTAAY